MSSVDALADNMAATTIAPVAPEGANNVAGGQPINAAENEAVIAAAAEGRRLYIGNLAYATTEGDLKSFFTVYSVYVLWKIESKLQGILLTVFRETTSIPTNPRTTRPVGYAFVDLSTADEAEKAITELSGKQILDRKVSVQLARKPETAAEKQAAAAANGGEGAEGGGENGRRRNSGRGRGRGRGRGGRGARGGRVCACRAFSTISQLTRSSPAWN